MRFDQMKKRLPLVEVAVRQVLVECVLWMQMEATPRRFPTIVYTQTGHLMVKGLYLPQRKMIIGIFLP
jgi:hypothetical protein